MSNLTLKKLATLKPSFVTEVEELAKSQKRYNEWFKQGMRPMHFISDKTEGSTNKPSMWQAMLDMACIGIEGEALDLHRLGFKDYCEKYKVTKAEWKAMDDRKKRYKKIQSNRIKVWKTAMQTRMPTKPKAAKKPAKLLNYVTEATQFKDICSDITDTSIDVVKICDLMQQVIELLPATNIVKSGE
jgi:hypothetical protein